ncbi:hypothetical protein RUM43_006082 [Polyplax serrata]|uniref:Uncharacterized protein n=1 Tax=Polyplax serrata TaxID=468196 RepID=A0AAN8P0V9_POLSC
MPSWILPDLPRVCCQRVDRHQQTDLFALAVIYVSRVFLLLGVYGKAVVVPSERCKYLTGQEKHRGSNR